MRTFILILVAFLILLLSGCLAFYEKTIDSLAGQMVKDLNDVLSGEQQANYFISEYVYLGSGATNNDANYFGGKFLDFITVSASSVEFVSVADSAVKSFEISNPPSWVAKVFDLTVHLRTPTQIVPAVLPALLIGNKLYVLTVYVEGTQTKVYPKSAIFQ